jgi:hypothetical protein
VQQQYGGKSVKRYWPAGGDVDSVSTWVLDFSLVLFNFLIFLRLFSIFAHSVQKTSGRRRACCGFTVSVIAVWIFAALL